jgi:hypothetical protein
MTLHHEVMSSNEAGKAVNDEEVNFGTHVGHHSPKGTEGNDARL